MTTRPVTPSRLRRGRLVSVLVVAAALGFSPTVAPLLSGLLHPAPVMQMLPELPARTGSHAEVSGYARSAQGFQHALDSLQVGERRRVSLSELTTSANTRTYPAYPARRSPKAVATWRAFLNTIVFREASFRVLKRQVKQGSDKAQAGSPRLLDS